MQAMKLKLAAAAALAALAVWGVMQHGAQRVQPRPGTPAHAEPAASSAPGAKGWFSAVGGPPAAAAGAANVATDATAAEPLPLEREVAMLAASGRPEDSYRAYNLIDDCMTFQKLGTLPFLHFPETTQMTGAEKAAEARRCAGMTELHRRARVGYLATAAQAGVPGANVAFMVAGPFGDRDALATRPDDPLVIEWKQQALAQLTAQALQGDIASLDTLWTGHLSGWIAIPRDPVLAYTYHAALQRIDHQQNPAVADGPYSGNMFAFLKDGLTPQQLAAADAQAERIAQHFRQRAEAQKAQR